MSNGVIFDMDGVLVDSLEAHFKAFKKIGEELGKPFTRELLLRTVGMHNSEIFPLWLGTGLNAERARDLADRKEALYREFAEDTLKPIPGVVELLDRLGSAGFSLAVGSSGPNANVRLALRVLDVEKHFSAVVTGDDVRRGKPDPEIFLTASRKLGLAPADCLVIEDAPQGVKAAKAAKMAVIALTSSRARQDLTEASFIVDSHDEITPGLVGDLIKKARMPASSGL